MPRIKSEEEQLAGKLISAIQKIWGDQAGELEAELTESKMGLGHDLLKARNSTEMKVVLGGKTVMQLLGEEWLKKYPLIRPFATRLNQKIYEKDA